MQHHGRFNKDYVHHQTSSVAEVLREVVFGLQDGMVSTLGSITGIAIGSGSLSTVILAGVVIISVESISMGIGSYVSNISEEEMNRRKLHEENEELHQYPDEEKRELYLMYIKDGWPEALASQMSEAASQEKKLMLKEMALRELKVPHEEESLSLRGGIYMFFSYVIGGLVPLLSYFILPMRLAIPTSIVVTLVGLFLLGAGTTKYTKQPLVKSSLRVLVMGGIALAAGLAAGLLIGN